MDKLHGEKQLVSTLGGFNQRFLVCLIPIQFDLRIFFQMGGSTTNYNLVTFLFKTKTTRNGRIQMIPDRISLSKK